MVPAGESPSRSRRNPARPPLHALAGVALDRTFALRSPFIGGGLVTVSFPLIAVRFGNLWLGAGSLVPCAVMLAIARPLGLWNRPPRARQQA